MTKQIKNVKDLQSKSRQNDVQPLGGNIYQVTSATSGKVYQVRHSGAGCTCNCNWAKYRPAGDDRSGCSHVLAVVNFVAQLAGAASVSAWTDEDSARRQHRPMIDIGDGVIVTVRS